MHRGRMITFLIRKAMVIEAFISYSDSMIWHVVMRFVLSFKCEPS